MDRTLNRQIQKRNVIIFTVILILMVAVITAMCIILLLTTGRETEEAGERSGGMAYEANVITDDADALQDAVNRLIEKAKEGQMSLEMQTVASSEDGRTFSCYLANSAKNNYDMFMVFYLDNTRQEIYRTGLIPIGARIEEFTLEEALEPGTYEATIVYNQVEEDRETIHAQVNVGVTFIVR